MSSKEIRRLLDEFNIQDTAMVMRVSLTGEGGVKKVEAYCAFCKTVFWSVEESSDADSLCIEHAIQQHGERCEKMGKLLRMAERYL